MSAPVDLPNLPIGGRVQDTLLVLDVSPRTQASGDPYTVLTLGNSTGSISTEPFWLERQNEVAGLRRGHAVQVIGEITSFRERPQLKVISIRHLPDGTVDASALLPSVGSVERYWRTLDGWRREITRPRLRRVVDLFYEDEAFRRRYERCPGSVRHHHAQLGGLLKHTAEVAAIGRAIARTSGADLQLVVAGALLHDIGKLEEYSWDGVFATTERGRLVGHVALGALWLERRLAAEPEPPCTAVEQDILLHFILSHHGRREFGSPVEPMTLEAEVLHLADHASARVAVVGDTLQQDALFPDGSVSTPQRILEGRRLFRGTSDWGERS